VKTLLLSALCGCQCLPVTLEVAVITSLYRWNSKRAVPGSMPSKGQAISHPLVESLGEELWPNSRGLRMSWPDLFLSWWPIPAGSTAPWVGSHARRATFGDRALAVPVSARRWHPSFWRRPAAKGAWIGPAPSGGRHGGTPMTRLTLPTPSERCYASA